MAVSNVYVDLIVWLVQYGIFKTI